MIGARFLPRLAPKAAQFGRVGKFDQNLEDELRDLFKAFVVDLVRIVTGPVIIAVHSGVHHYIGNVVRVKSVVIAVGFDFPVKVEQQVLPVILPTDKPPQIATGACSKHLEVRVAQSPDHVGIDHDGHPVERDRGMVHPMFRAD